VENRVKGVKFRVFPNGRKKKGHFLNIFVRNIWESPLEK